MEEAIYILKDYLYWFNKGDDVSLILFFSGEKPPKKFKEIFDSDDRLDKPKAVFNLKKVESHELHRYYSKSILVNEVANYRSGDLFRIYKLMNPARLENNFENQAISIQSDIRYDQTLKKPYKAYFPEHISHISDAVDFYQPKSLLDCGCGSGANYFFLKEKILKSGINYTGIDQSRFQIIKAKDLYEKENIQFIPGNLQNIPFNNNSFDFSFSESTLPFLDNPLKGIQEMARVSKKGFFCSLFTFICPIKDHPFDKKNQSYKLNTGATWKFYENVTPNVFSVPLKSDVIDMLNEIPEAVWIEDNSSQFFQGLGLRSNNIFIFPKDWYNSRKASFKGWNFKPLM